MRLTSPLGYLLLLATAAAFPAPPSPGRDARIEELLRQMTLEEKTGQLNQYSAGQPTGPGTHRHSYETMIAAGQVGSLLNVTRAEQVNHYQRIAVERSRLHIPLLFGLDVIHGFRTIFPVNLGLSSTWDPALVEETSRVAAEEAAAQGIRWTFSPMVDIARDARWGRIAESAGEDPYLGSVLARAYVRGYQGQRLQRPDLDPRLRETFRRVWRGGGRARLQHHRHLRALAAPGLSEPVPRQRRGGRRHVHVRLQFVERRARQRERVRPSRHLARGVGLQLVWSSATGEPSRRTIAHGIATNGATAARQIVPGRGRHGHGERSLCFRIAWSRQLGRRSPAGARRIGEAGPAPEGRPRAVREPLCPPADSTAASARARPRRRVAPAGAARSGGVVRPAQELGSPRQQAPILPLVAKPGRTIALIGPLADSARDMLGCWSAQGIPDDVITLKAALAQRTAAEGMTLLYAEGSKILGNDRSGFDEAIRLARKRRRGDPGPRRRGRSNWRGRLASAPEPRRPARGAARGNPRHGQAGHRGAVQRSPAHDRLGGRARGSDRRRLVPGRGGGPGARADALR